MLALGDFLQQTREKRKDPERVRDWTRTGEASVTCTAILLWLFFYHPFYLNNGLFLSALLYRTHVCSGILNGTSAALLVRLAG